MICHFNSIPQLSSLQDLLFNNIHFKPQYETKFQPAVDVYEDKEALSLYVEVPGVRLEDINIDVDQSILTIKGERKLQHEDQTKNYHRVERAHGSFSRVFTLPRTLDTDKIEARLEHGLLTLRIPKKEDVKPRKIEIANSN